MGKLYKVAQRYGKKAFAAGSSLVAGSAMAALDTATVQTALTSAENTGTTVGGYVVGAVAALVVIGVVISIVRKL